MSTNTNRMPLIDALKAIAALLVLLNHFSSYGPLAAAVNQIFPATVVWLYGYGRMAVQVFLVIAGFLAAQPEIAEVLNLITLAWGDRMVIAVKARMTDQERILGDELVTRINAVEDRLQARWPAARWVFFEPDVR